MVIRGHKQERKKRGIKGSWLFLGFVLFVYGITASMDITLVRDALVLFGDTFQQILPVLLLVFVLMVLFNYFLDAQRIDAYLGATSGVTGWLLAVVGGVLATGPVYSWYILMGELKQKGMKPALIAVFLYSRAVKIPLLPLLVHYFGTTFTVILSLYLLFFAVTSGLLMERLAGPEQGDYDH